MLHRHIGVGSVFIAENPELTGFTGFVFDFDLSLMTKKPPTNHNADATHPPVFDGASVHKEPNQGLEEQTVGGNPSGLSQTRQQ